MKVGTRLETIATLVKTHYDHIWDGCCDHGLLGMLLLQRRSADKVHFVDVLSTPMAKLQEQLERFFPANDEDLACWEVHCQKLETLQLTRSDKHLVIIAGIGGDKVIEFVTSIKTNHPFAEIEFLLCPVHHNYRVRSAMIKLGLGLIDEKLVTENGRFYEILHLSSGSTEPLSKVGSKMWDFTCSEHRQYLINQIEHFEQKARTGDEAQLKILKAYRELRV